MACVIASNTCGDGGELERAELDEVAAPPEPAKVASGDLVVTKVLTNLDIKPVANTSMVRKMNTVPMPYSMRLTPWSIKVSCIG